MGGVDVDSLATMSRCPKTFEDIVCEMQRVNRRLDFNACEDSDDETEEDNECDVESVNKPLLSSTAGSNETCPKDEGEALLKDPDGR